jgi:ABC-type multidrug transport system ATPase subunit
MTGRISARVESLLVSDWNVWSSAHWIVRQVYLSLPAGCLAVVAGRNGSGKSTFLRSLAGLLSTNEGWLCSGTCEFVTGLPLGAEQPRWKTVAYMSQSLAASEDLNVDAFLKLENEKLCKESSQLIHRLGLSDLSSVRLSELSGGQWQRVRLARTLMKDSPVLLLDEPDSALDGYWRRVLWELLGERKAQGQLILVVLHRPRDVLGLATHWLGFDRGTLMFCESHRDVYPEALLDRLFLGKTLDSSECVD